VTLLDPAKHLFGEVNALSNNLRNEIKFGKLPNTVVSVAEVKDGGFVVAFSTNTAPGLVYYVNPKREQNEHIFFDRNSQMAGRPVVTNSDPHVNEEIIRTINLEQKLRHTTNV
jgi:hypothetical protein